MSDLYKAGEDERELTRDTFETDLEILRDPSVGHLGCPNYPNCDSEGCGEY